MSLAMSWRCSPTTSSLLPVIPRGHGGSEKPHKAAAYEDKLNVADTLAVLDQLNVAAARFFRFFIDGGLDRFCPCRSAPGHFSSLIIGGRPPYQDNREVSNHPRLQALKQGPKAIVALWPTPLSPTLEGPPAGERRRGPPRRPNARGRRKRRLCGGAADHDHALLTLCGRGGCELSRCQGVCATHAQRHLLLFAGSHACGNLFPERFSATAPSYPVTGHRACMRAAATTGFRLTGVMFFYEVGVRVRAVCETGERPNQARSRRPTAYASLPLSGAAHRQRWTHRLQRG